MTSTPQGQGDPRQGNPPFAHGDMVAALAALVAPKLPAAHAPELEGLGPRLGRSRGLDDLAALIGLVQVHEVAGDVLHDLTQLLTRTARRHINLVTTLPPAATVAARCLDHLLSHCTLAHGATTGDNPGADAEVDTSILHLRQVVSEHLTSWGTSDRLTPADLDQRIQVSHGAGGEPTRMALALGQDLELLRTVLLLVVELFEQQIRSNPPWGLQFSRGRYSMSQWVSLDDADRRCQLTETGPQSLAAIRQVLAQAGQQSTPGSGLADLIQGRLGSYVTDLARGFDLIQSCLGGLERCERHGLAALHLSSRSTTSSGNGSSGSTAGWRTENTLVVLALCQRLRHEGETPDDIESFARAIMDGTAQHEIAIHNLLESEIQDYGPRLAPLSVTRALRFVKYEDPDCPISVTHKQWISAAIDAGDQLSSALARRRDGAPAPATAPASSRSDSMP